MKILKIHFIAIGGAAMHNIALDLLVQGHLVTGSDDEIYEPSLGRLRGKGLAPSKFGWFPDKITADLDFVILGMHAKQDNPELLEALKLRVPVLSYPEFIYTQSLDKKRVVIAGSHGKTTTTAMILHVMKDVNIDVDFLVGAQLEGFDRMAKLTNAPIIIIEGDEYLSSPIDRRPKIHHYHPHISVITGIAWDHINVFPTFEIYKDQFSIYLNTFEKDGLVIYNENDAILSEIIHSNTADIHSLAYTALEKYESHAITFEGEIFPISVIGSHNLQNMSAALKVCKALRVAEMDFFKSISNFKGASKRLQVVSENETRIVYLDFAHAPSKVLATTKSVKDWYGDQKLLAVLELHTFSSLNQQFLGQYKASMDAADVAIVFYNAHTLTMKNMPELDKNLVLQSFGHKNMIIINNRESLHAEISKSEHNQSNILLMSSGNFDKMNIDF